MGLSLVSYNLIISHLSNDCRVFDFLRLIRNTLHNNGVHIPISKKEKKSIDYKGITYDFIEGENLKFVTWDLLLDIADDMRTLIFHIAHNKTISSIPGIILDSHAI